MNQASFEDGLRAELSRLAKAGLLRRLVTTSVGSGDSVVMDGKSVVDLSSNDYLGLSRHPLLKRAAMEAIDKYGVGARASRLMSGNFHLYDQLEEAIASLKGTEASLVFGSGYLCNLSVISGLVGPSHCIVMDKLCHASIVDGALLSRARIIRFPHNDLEYLEGILKRKRQDYKGVLIVAESLYSMDGDFAPVNELVALGRKYNALVMVDEAHALGVFGKRGEGLIAQDSQEKPDLIIGTFGKALGSYGAFCATSKVIKDFLINKARGLIYSTALPPGTLAANIEAVNLVVKLTDARQKVLEIADDFRDFVQRELCLATRGKSQIVPLILKEVSEVAALEAFLREHHILAKAIRPPTVPKDSPRIRFSFCAHHGRDTLHLIKKVLREFFKKGQNS